MNADHQPVLPIFSTPELCYKLKRSGKHDQMMIRAMDSYSEPGGWATFANWGHIRGESFALRIGDAEAALLELPDGSVDTCLTSPPYWRARDYDEPEQIGLEESLENYLTRIVRVFAQVRRILTPGGTAWLNVGDCYYNSSDANERTRTEGWRRNKQLSLVPFRLAIALEDDGWLIRNPVIWHKPNAMPSSVRDRLTNTWEPFFLLANPRTTSSTWMRLGFLTGQAMPWSDNEPSAALLRERPRAKTIYADG